MKPIFLIPVLLFCLINFYSCKENKNTTPETNTLPIQDSLKSEIKLQDLVSEQLDFKNNMPHGIAFGLTKEEIKNLIKDSIFRDDSDTLTYTITKGKDFWDYTFAMDKVTKKYNAFYLDFYCMDSTLSIHNFKIMKDFLESNKETFGELHLVDTTSWQGTSTCCKTELQWVHEENDLGYQFMFSKK